ncbi:MAG: hypothetical protein U5K55_01360 [Aliarcobacter sp.]|nr:hypothetical protein [Aliarcobacter sp.]
MLVITFNGEVYNYLEIKKELCLLGYVFFSDSDTEVILKAYHQWGIDSIKKFIGMFVIVIYDKKKQEIIIIRDRVGIKPLYYYFDNNKFIFASELKSIISSNATLSISKEGLYNFLQYGYIAKDLSIFENIKKLPAGNYLIFSIKKEN